MAQHLRQMEHKVHNEWVADYNMVEVFVFWPHDQATRTYSEVE